MSAAVKKLDGIESVGVSISDGKATIKCKPTSKATVEQIRRAIIDAGFTPHDAEAQLVGKVIERDGKLALAVAGSGAIYSLGGNEVALKSMVGKSATVTARVPEGENKLSPLQVTSVKPADGR